MTGRTPGVLSPGVLPALLVTCFIPLASPENNA